MHLSVYLPFLFSAVFGVAAPVLARRLPPQIGTWLLSAGGLLAAIGSGTSLALLGFTLVGQTPLLAAHGRWSEVTLRRADPVIVPVAFAALAVLGMLTVRFAAAGVRRLIALRQAYRLSASLPASCGELAVIDHPGRQAYAVPGRPGRIVVSTGLLRGLNARERRAVLAHERAHLAHRHHLHHTIAHLTAAANPLLYRLPEAVALATERWADECAAALCRRDTVADAISRAAIGSSHPLAAAALAAAETEVLSRVQALRAPAAQLSVWRVSILAALVTAITVAVLVAARDTEQLFELAQRAYRTAHPHP